MKTFSLDLRERILSAYDTRQFTRQEVADRFLVSLGMVKKLLAQRRSDGDIAPRDHRAGRKPKITADHRRQLDEWVRKQPDLTLEELRGRLGVECSLPAVHYALKAMGLTYKKRVSSPPSKSAPMSRKNARNGGRR